MTLRNVNYVLAEKMTQQQRDDLKIREKEGLVAIETHNPEFRQTAVVLKKGLSHYILHGE